MDGFAANYAATLQGYGLRPGPRGRSWATTTARTSRFTIISPPNSPSAIGWFSSVPGATWPNRLYAMCGHAAGSRDGHPHNLPPLYNQPSFVRHLDAHGISWRWYSTDVGTLRMADELYCLGHHDRFAYFTTTGLPWKAVLNWRVQADIPSFLEDAAAGTLPSVSWIDPSFGNFNPLGLQQNDDHPPADVKDGQDLVLAVYDAVATGPQWDKTLLVSSTTSTAASSTMSAPDAADDHPKMFGRYGVRVPALIVSPWVRPGRCQRRCSITRSIIKTILLRFLRRGPRTPRSPGEPSQLAQSRAIRAISERASRTPTTWENF